MKEIKNINPTIKENFTSDETAELSKVSELVHRDMMRYDRTLNAEEEVNEY
ncbi:MAG: hypothetical protein PUG48_02600 [Clostridia bacterium]|nr:hypothetical protein [Clostridia bacterium]